MKQLILLIAFMVLGYAAFAEDQTPPQAPQLYSILMCIKGAGCRFFDVNTVFDSYADCIEYRNRLGFPPNVRYSCVPVSYTQGAEQ
jgi:hypothetical protein